MVDKGWRKRLHDKKPKVQANTKATGEKSKSEKTLAEDALQPKRPPERSTEPPRTQPSEKSAWRRIYHGSRPDTPVALFATASGGDDTEDTYSEKSSEAPSRRGKTTPRAHKLNHYLSAYLNLQGADDAEEFSFSAPWGLFPPPVEPPIDPEVAIQKIRSHITRRSWKPLPAEYNSGVLRVFEDHRKVREENERLSKLTRDTLEAWQAAQGGWDKTEDLYQREIRRLEHLIAQGKTGMHGLMAARQGSIVDRKRLHRRGSSHNQPEKVQEGLTNEQIDEQIKLMSTEVSLQRPASPSGKMTALSQKLMTQGSTVELLVGTPPKRDTKRTLSRRVKSELALTNMGAISETSKHSVGIDFADDTSPLEQNDIAEPVMDIGVECDAFVTLRHLAVMVARRRGMDVGEFVCQLMRLLSDDDDVRDMDGQDLARNESDIGTETPDDLLLDARSGLSQRRLRHFRSEPGLTADINRRRHFSFEPGEDHLGRLNDKLMEIDRNRPKSPAGSQSTTSTEDQDRALSCSQVLGADAPKPSKIPSPLHQPSLGRPRRDNSTTGLRTLSGRDRQRLDDRRDSSSSVLTAFRQNSNGSLRRPEPTSRSSSITNFQQTNLESRDHTGCNRLRNSPVALAAARVASINSVTESMTSEPGKEDRSSSATCPRTQVHNASGKSTFLPSTENDRFPQRRQQS